MKKLFMVAMAIVVAAGFVACTKEDVSAPTYKVEFTVGDKGGFGVNSRAVKTAWAAGDQVAVVFEVENDQSLRFRLDNIKMTSAGGTEVIASFNVKDFTVLKYLE